MNKLTSTTAIFLAMTATSVFAHHPAADMVDAETYEMIDANVADTPHADMVLGDMGSAMGSAVGSSSMDQAALEQSGPVAAMDGVDVDAAMEAAASVDTMDLMENVDNALVQ
jgi:hypothetical protein